MASIELVIWDALADWIDTEKLTLHVVAGPDECYTAWIRDGRVAVSYRINPRPLATITPEWSRYIAEYLVTAYAFDRFMKLHHQPEGERCNEHSKRN